MTARKTEWAVRYEMDTIVVWDTEDRARRIVRDGDRLPSGEYPVEVLRRTITYGAWTAKGDPPAPTPPGR